MSKGYLYIMSTAGRWKVGLSNDPERRFDQLKNAATPDLQLHDIFPTGYMAKAEKMAHDRLKEMGFHFKGEVFEGCTYEEVRQVVAASAMMFNTTTEDKSVEELTFEQKVQRIDGQTRELARQYNAWDATDQQKKKLEKKMEDLAPVMERLVSTHYSGMVSGLSDGELESLEDSSIIEQKEMWLGRTAKEDEDFPWVPYDFNPSAYFLQHACFEEQENRKDDRKRQANEAERQAEQSEIDSTHWFFLDKDGKPMTTYRRVERVILTAGQSIVCLFVLVLVARCTYVEMIG